MPDITLTLIHLKQQLNCLSSLPEHRQNITMYIILVGDRGPSMNGLNWLIHLVQAPGQGPLFVVQNITAY